MKAKESEKRNADLGAGVHIHSSTKVFITVDEQKTWDQAKVSCENMGARLATFPDPEEQKNLMDALLPIGVAQPNHWIGLRYNTAKKFWYWSTGIKLQWSDRPDIIHNQPWTYRLHEDCVFLYHKTGLMRETCSYKKPFICEKRMKI